MGPCVQRSPPSIFVDADFNVKYGDFGQAYRHGQNTLVTGSRKGHEEYGPPQLGDVRVQEVRQAHDMWALGSVLGELVLKETVTELGVTGPRHSRDARAQFVARVTERDPGIALVVEQLLAWDDGTASLTRALP